MPPKAKYSKQEILEKAVEIIVEQGYEKLTARELAAALGTSAKPIFTAFENMEDVKKGCFDFAFDKYHSYFANGLGESPFKNIGKIYVKFAQNEPQLYKLIFLQSQDKALSFSDYMKKLDDCYEDTLKLIEDYYSLNREKAEQLYKNMWIFSTGIATLCATKQCSFSDEEIENLMNITCVGVLNELRK